MPFVQIIEMRTKNYEELQSLGDEYFAATEGKRTVQRSLVTRDRNDPERYLILAFFDSYESAMENSNLPETAAFAEKQMTLIEAPPNSYDLDVVEDRTEPRDVGRIMAAHDQPHLSAAALFERHCWRSNAASS